MYSCSFIVTLKHFTYWFPQSVGYLVKGTEKETPEEGWSTVLITALGSWGKPVPHSYKSSYSTKAVERVSMYLVSASSRSICISVKRIAGAAGKAEVLSLAQRVERVTAQ